MKTYSLYELNDFIRKVFLLNFEDPVWVQAEIVQANTRRGHTYLQLAEYSDVEEVIASSTAIVWQSALTTLLKHHGQIVEGVFKEGIEVKLLCQVGFDARYGYSLIVKDVDIEYTFGKLFVQRQQTIERLENEHLFDLNKELAIAPIIRRMAVISSSKAAGWADFQNQLIENPYGYSYQIDLYSAAVQGQNAVPEMLGALDMISDRLDQSDYDLVVILRGGGSRLDLAAFDDYELTKSVALSPIPVLCAIGHETDTSVLDMIAHSSAKTPTAAADFILQWNMQQEEQVLRLTESAISGLARQITDYRLLISNYQNRIKQNALMQINGGVSLISRLQSSIGFRSLTQVTNMDKILLKLEKDIYLKDVEAVLDKGFAMIEQNNRWIKHKSEIHNSSTSELQITFADGKQAAHIKANNNATS